MKKIEIFKNGLLNSNPVFIMLLGLCSALAITYDLDNAIAMSAAMIFVLFFSNLLISLLRKFIHKEIRIPIYIIIIATLVTIVSIVMEAFAYDLYTSLGVYLPLIVVNCIILGRAEVFASKNKVGDSLIDALANGLGYAFALIIISLIREGVGTGTIEISNPLNLSQILFSTDTIFNFFSRLIDPMHPYFLTTFIKENAIGIFVEPIGAFLTLALLIPLFTFIFNKKEVKEGEK